ncbi:hypothetical protein BKA69DRAFT_1124990 [Paraphysoderma sedebokerense]|nr:hypothetical protein BKA69DRAFT_1124990 [Paraphysoderma sedebokerense]
MRFSATLLLSCVLSSTVVSLNAEDSGDTNDWTLVGYHGSCSQYKESLEDHIEIPITSAVNVLQLGKGRFYVADAQITAKQYAERGCGGKDSSLADGNMMDRTKKETSNRPIICSIYANAEKLPTFKKIYIPDISESVSAPLHFSDTAMWEFEQQNGIDVDKDSAIRFAPLPQARSFHSRLQTAWPSETFDYLKAKCGYIEDLDDKFDGRINYHKLLVSGGDEVWGSIIGSENYKSEFREFRDSLRRSRESRNRRTETEDSQGDSETTNESRSDATSVIASRPMPKPQIQSPFSGMDMPFRRLSKRFLRNSVTK